MYNLTVHDKAGDGFTKGSGSFIKVFVDGVESKSISGNFGNSTTLLISRQNDSTKRVKGGNENSFTNTPNTSHSNATRKTSLYCVGAAFAIFYIVFG
jgi:hypothetical protein